MKSCKSQELCLVCGTGKAGTFLLMGAAKILALHMPEGAQALPGPSTLRHGCPCAWGQRLGKLLRPRRTRGTGLLTAHPRACRLLLRRAQVVAEGFSHGD